MNPVFVSAGREKTCIDRREETNCPILWPVIEGYHLEWNSVEEVIKDGDGADS